MLEPSNNFVNFKTYRPIKRAFTEAKKNSESLCMKSFKRYQLAYLALLNSGKYSIVFEVTFNVRQYLLFFIVPCFIINFIK